jgi:hypothetical protein
MKKIIIFNVLIFVYIIYAFDDPKIPYGEYDLTGGFPWVSEWIELHEDSTFTYNFRYDFKRFQPVTGIWHSRCDTLILNSHIQPTDVTFSKIIEKRIDDQIGIKMLFFNSKGDTLNDLYSLLFNNNELIPSQELHSISDTTFAEDMRTYSKDKSMYINKINPFYDPKIDSITGDNIKIIFNNLIWCYELQKKNSNYFEFYLKYPEDWRWPGARRYFTNTKYLYRDGKIMEITE